MKITIKKPCSENWEAMTTVEKGRFCQSCQKNVIDFTQMTHPEIKDYIQEQSGVVCGRFHSSKLDEFNGTYQPLPTPSNIHKWAMAAILAGCISLPIFAQQPTPITSISPSIIQWSLSINSTTTADHLEILPTGDSIILKGKTVDTYGESLPFANVYIEGTSIGVVSDLDGFFQLKVPKSPYSITLQANHIGFSRFYIDIVPDRSKTDLLFTLQEHEEILGIIVLSPKELKAQKHRIKKQGRQVKRKNKNRQ